MYTNCVIVVSFSNLTEGTALSCAAANGHDVIVQYLLHNSVSTSGGYYKSDLKVTTSISTVYNNHIMYIYMHNCY